MFDFPLITNGTTFDGVILANGDYPTHAIPAGILERAVTLVCCDGHSGPRPGHHPYLGDRRR
jgi:hypothetical protein